MKWIILTVAFATTTADGTPFPRYDVDKACSEAAAISVKDGMDGPDAMAMVALCRTMIGMAKDVAEPLWEMTDEARRSECASRVEAESRERGMSQGWYPALVDCMRGTSGGKSDRLVQD